MKPVHHQLRLWVVSLARQAQKQDVIARLLEQVARQSATAVKTLLRDPPGQRMSGRRGRLAT